MEVDGEVDGEVFNEEVDEDAETLPLPGLSGDITSLNAETPECFEFDPVNRGLAAPSTPADLPAPSTPVGMAVPTMSPESTLLLASIFRHRYVISIPRYLRV